MAAKRHKRDRKQPVPAEKESLPSKSEGKKAAAPSYRPPSSPARKWGFRLAALTLVPALFFIVVDLILRVAGFGYPTGFFLPDHVESQSVYTDNPRFGWQFFPRALAREPFNFVLPKEKSAGTIRVFVLGGSAAMGDPEPSFSFARVLQAILEARFPGKMFQVVNAAMTGINSHVVRTIARDCAARRPDFFVVYMGNNEVIGPYGPGTVFGSFRSSLALIHFGLWLKTTALVQAMETAKTGLFGGNGEFKQWGGMRMFLKHRVPAGDPKLKTMNAEFRENLIDILEYAHDAGARTVLCTVASNLGDCAPFASMNKPILDGKDTAAWDDLYTSGSNLQNQARFAEAVRILTQAATINDASADVHYRLAQCLDRMGRFDEAKAQFVRARDLDALRFRADTSINDSIRQVAKTEAALGVDFVDAVDRFAADSPHGIPGDNLFVDHVHFNFHGAYLLARAVAQQMAKDLDKKNTEADDGHAAGFPSESDCARRLAYTRWNTFQITDRMMTRMRKPPFVNQLDHEARLKELEKRLDALRDATVGKGLDATVKTYRDAIEKHPGDWVLHENFARVLQHTPRAAEEAEQWKAVLRRLPHHLERNANLGQALARAGKFQQAIDACQIAIRYDPKNINAYNGMGIALAGLGRTDDAMNQYRKAIALRPDYTDARNNLALLLVRKGRDDDAVTQYQDMLKVDPNDAGANENLAFLYIKKNEYKKAFDHFTQAARLDPTDSVAEYHLGVLEASRDNIQKAIDHFKRAIELDPGMTDAHVNLGALLAQLGLREEASEQLDTALKQRPGDPSANFNYGVMFERDGDVDAAQVYYQRSVKGDPNNVRAQYRLGLCYEGLGKIKKAIAQYRIALQLAPEWPDAENELAWVLCTHENPTAKELKEAVELAESACKHTGNKNATMLDTLAAAYAGVKKFDDAAKTAAKALQLAKDTNQPSLASDIQKRIALYKEHHPYLDRTAESTQPSVFQ